MTSTINAPQDSIMVYLNMTSTINAPQD